MIYLTDPELLKEFFPADGWQQIKTDAPGIDLWFQQSDPYVYAAAICSEPAERGITPEGLSLLLGRLRSLLTENTGREPSILTVITTAQPEKYLEGTKNFPALWLIDTAEDKLIIPEGHLNAFLGLEKKLPALFTLPDDLPEEKPSATLAYYVKQQPPVTVSLIAANILVFLIFEAFVSEASLNALVDRFGIYWPAIFEDGEYWRLLTGMFLHGGISHLLNNMLCLYVIGSRLEFSSGRGRMLAVYFPGGILAGVTSALYNRAVGDAVVAVGASGAIFALIGGMVALLLKKRGKVEGLTLRQMIIFAAFSLYGGFANFNTDNAAHIGGLIAGFLIALLIMPGRNTKETL